MVFNCVICIHIEWPSTDSLYRISRRSPSAIANTKKRKGRNESRGLEVTDRLIEHSWFRRKFGASRSARFAWPTLVSWFYRLRYMDRLGRLAARSLLVGVATSIKRNCRPARNGKGRLDRFQRKKKRERKKKTAHYYVHSAAADSCFSIFYEPPTSSLTTVYGLIYDLLPDDDECRFRRAEAFPWFLKFYGLCIFSPIFIT